MTKQYVVETIELVKKQYVLSADNMVDAHDKVEMGEIKFYDKVKLNETIVSITDYNGIRIPNVKPLREAQLNEKYTD